MGNTRVQRCDFPEKAFTTLAAWLQSPRERWQHSRVRRCAMERRRHASSSVWSPSRTTTYLGAIIKTGLYEKILLLGPVRFHL